jgi:cytochrome c peroxidase
MRANNLCSVVVATLAMSGCMSDKMVDAFTEEEFDLIKQFQLTSGPPPNTTNKYADNEQAAVFGQQLFFEKTYAGKLTVADPALGAVGDTGKLACASCHDVTRFYVDTRSKPNNLSLGVKVTTRNAPTLVNVAYYQWNSWGGKEDSLWYQGANGCESAVNFGGNRLQYAHMLYLKYRTQYNALFPVPIDPLLDPTPGGTGDLNRFPLNGAPGTAGTPLDTAWKGMTDGDRDIVNTIMANVGKAIEAYERKLVSRNAPIDRYIAGDHAALTSAQKRGLQLFIGKAACVDCHSGPTMTDSRFYNTGIPQAVGLNAPPADNGRFDEIPKTLSNNFNTASKYSDDQELGKAKLIPLMQTEDLRGRFRTGMLRQIEMTGPYMHNGSLATLEDVVRFYNWGGGSAGFAGTKSPGMVPLLLTDGEQADLVAFLHALTGDPPPAELGKNTASTEMVAVPPVN